jgi:uncharacterized phage infection (PIP) family protein YhgE
MDSQLKNPAVVLSVADAIAIIGVAVYFSRQFSAVNSVLADLSVKLDAVAKKVYELQQPVSQVSQISDAVNTLNKGINRLKSEVSKQEDEAEDKFDRVFEALSKGNIAVDQPKKKKKTNKRKKKKYSSDEDSDFDTDILSSLKKK